MLWLVAAVFLSDAAISWLSGLYLDARSAHNRLKAAALDALLATVIGVNAMGFVELHWIMLVPSAAGAAVGSWLSMSRPRPS